MADKDIQQENVVSIDTSVDLHSMADTVASILTAVAAQEMATTRLTKVIGVINALKDASIAINENFSGTVTPESSQNVARLHREIKKILELFINSTNNVENFDQKISGLKDMVGVIKRINENTKSQAPEVYSGRIDKLTKSLNKYREALVKVQGPQEVFNAALEKANISIVAHDGPTPVNKKRPTQTSIQAKPPIEIKLLPTDYVPPGISSQPKSPQGSYPVTSPRLVGGNVHTNVPTRPVINFGPNTPSDNPPIYGNVGGIGDEQPHFQGSMEELLRTLGLSSAHQSNVETILRKKRRGESPGGGLSEETMNVLAKYVAGENVSISGVGFGREQFTINRLSVPEVREIVSETSDRVNNPPPARTGPIQGSSSDRPRDRQGRFVSRPIVVEPTDEIADENYTFLQKLQEGAGSVFTDEQLIAEFNRISNEMPTNFKRPNIDDDFVNYANDPRKKKSTAHRTFMEKFRELYDYLSETARTIITPSEKDQELQEKYEEDTQILIKMLQRIKDPKINSLDTREGVTWKQLVSGAGISNEDLNMLLEIANDPASRDNPDINPYEWKLLARVLKYRSYHMGDVGKVAGLQDASRALGQSDRQMALYGTVDPRKISQKQLQKLIDREAKREENKQLRLAAVGDIVHLVPDQYLDEDIRIREANKIIHLARKHYGRIHEAPEEYRDILEQATPILDDRGMLEVEKRTSQERTSRAAAKEQRESRRRRKEARQRRQLSNRYGVIYDEVAAGWWGGDFDDFTSVRRTTQDVHYKLKTNFSNLFGLSEQEIELLYTAINSGVFEPEMARVMQQAKIENARHDTLSLQDRDKQLRFFNKTLGKDLPTVLAGYEDGTSFISPNIELLARYKEFVRQSAIDQTPEYFKMRDAAIAENILFDKNRIPGSMVTPLGMNEPDVVRLLQDRKRQALAESMWGKRPQPGFDTEEIEKIKAHQRLLAQNESRGYMKMREKAIQENEMYRFSGQRGGWSPQGYYEPSSPLGRQFHIAGLRMAAYGVLGAGIYGGAQVLREGLQYIKEIEMSMVTLRKVLNPVTTDFGVLKQAIFEAGDQAGHSFKSAAEAVAVFARQGKTAFEAVELGKQALIMSNIGEIDQVKASQVLTSVLAQFNMTTGEAVDVADKLNNVSNKNAVSFQALADAAIQMGAAFEGQQGTLDEMVGSITALSKSTQLPGGMMGRAFRQFLIRLRTPKTQGLLQDAGVSYRDSLGRPSSPFQIMSSLSEKWSSLSLQNQFQIANSIGGGRFTSFFQSMINNWDAATKAYKDSLDSQGSAARENKIYMESYTAKVEQTKNAWAEMAEAVGSAGLLDMLKDLAEFSKGSAKTLTPVAVGVVGSPIGRAITGAPAIAASIGYAASQFGYFGNRIGQMPYYSPNQIDRLQEMSWTTQAARFFYQTRMKRRGVPAHAFQDTQSTGMFGMIGELGLLFGTLGAKTWIAIAAIAALGIGITAIVASIKKQEKLLKESYEAKQETPQLISFISDSFKTYNEALNQGTDNLHTIRANLLSDIAEYYENISKIPNYNGRLKSFDFSGSGVLDGQTFSDWENSLTPEERNSRYQKIQKELLEAELEAKLISIESVNKTADLAFNDRGSNSNIYKWSTTHQNYKEKRLLRFLSQDFFEDIDDLPETRKEGFATHGLKGLELYLEHVNKNNADINKTIRYLDAERKLISDVKDRANKLANYWEIPLTAQEQARFEQLLARNQGDYEKARQGIRQGVTRYAGLGVSDKDLLDIYGEGGRNNEFILAVLKQLKEENAFIQRAQDFVIDLEEIKELTKSITQEYNRQITALEKQKTLFETLNGYWNKGSKLILSRNIEFGQEKADIAYENLKRQRDLIKMQKDAMDKAVGVGGSAQKPKEGSAIYEVNKEINSIRQKIEAIEKIEPDLRSEQDKLDLETYKKSLKEKEGIASNWMSEYLSYSDAYDEHIGKFNEAEKNAIEIMKTRLESLDKLIESELKLVGASGLLTKVLDENASSVFRLQEGIASLTVELNKAKAASTLLAGTYNPLSPHYGKSDDVILERQKALLDYHMNQMTTTHQNLLNAQMAQQQSAAKMAEVERLNPGRYQKLRNDALNILNSLPEHIRKQIAPHGVDELLARGQGYSLPSGDGVPEDESKNKPISPSNGAGAFPSGGGGAGAMPTPGAETIPEAEPSKLPKYDYAVRRWHTWVGFPAVIPVSDDWVTKREELLDKGNIPHTKQGEGGKYWFLDSNGNFVMLTDEEAAAMVHKGRYPGPRDWQGNPIPESAPYVPPSTQPVPTSSLRTGDNVDVDAKITELNKILTDPFMNFSSQLSRDMKEVEELRLKYTKEYIEKHRTYLQALYVYNVNEMLVMSRKAYRELRTNIAEAIVANNIQQIVSMRTGEIQSSFGTRPWMEGYVGRSGMAKTNISSVAENAAEQYKNAIGVMQKLFVAQDSINTMTEEMRKQGINVDTSQVSSIIKGHLLEYQKLIEETNKTFEESMQKLLFVSYAEKVENTFVGIISAMREVYRSGKLGQQMQEIFSEGMRFSEIDESMLHSSYVQKGTQEGIQKLVQLYSDFSNIQQEIKERGIGDFGSDNLAVDEFTRKMSDFYTFMGTGGAPNEQMAGLLSEKWKTDINQLENTIVSVLDLIKERLKDLNLANFFSEMQSNYQKVLKDIDTQFDTLRKKLMVAPIINETISSMQRMSGISMLNTEYISIFNRNLEDSKEVANMLLDAMVNIQTSKISLSEAVDKLKDRGFDEAILDGFLKNNDSSGFIDKLSEWFGQAMSEASARALSVLKEGVTKSTAEGVIDSLIKTNGGMAFYKEMGDVYQRSYEELLKGMLKNATTPEMFNAIRQVMGGGGLSIANQFGEGSRERDLLSTLIGYRDKAKRRDAADLLTSAVINAPSNIGMNGMPTYLEVMRASGIRLNMQDETPFDQLNNTLEDGFTLLSRLLAEGNITVEQSNQILENIAAGRVNSAQTINPMEALNSPIVSQQVANEMIRLSQSVDNCFPPLTEAIKQLNNKFTLLMLQSGNIVNPVRNGTAVLPSIQPNARVSNESKK